MKVKILIILLVVSIASLLSFRVLPDEKKIKYEFTAAEVQLIYNALGELPAKQVEALRAKIAAEYMKQTDTVATKGGKKIP